MMIMIINGIAPIIRWYTAEKGKEGRGRSRKAAVFWPESVIYLQLMKEKKVGGQMKYEESDRIS